MNKHTRAAQKEWIRGDNWESKQYGWPETICGLICAAIMFAVLNGAADWVVGL